MPGTTARAQQYAADVSAAMFKLRGWNPATVPADVRDDVFATLARHSERYSRCFATGMDPQVAATMIQNAEWDR